MVEQVNESWVWKRIKEPLDVHGKEGKIMRRMLFLEFIHGWPKRNTSIRSRGKRFSTKLVRGDDIIVDGVKGDPIRNDFFQEFGKAFEKRNWTIRAGRSIIIFVGFGDNHYESLTPENRMIRKVKNRVKKRNEKGRYMRKGKFYKFIRNMGILR